MQKTPNRSWVWNRRSYGMEWKSVTISDTLIILATFLGPIVAVRLQKLIERYSERTRKRDGLFVTLMATRQVRANSSKHVEALNLIDLYFDSLSQKDKSVRNAWKLYFDGLQRRIDTNSPDASSQLERTVDLLVDLLHAMSEALDYEFDKVQIKRGAYYPQGHQDNETARQIIRDGMVRIATGQAALPIIVYPIPGSPLPSDRGIDTSATS